MNRMRRDGEPMRSSSRASCWDLRLGIGFDHEAKGGAGLAAGYKSIGAPGDGELFAIEEFADLTARMLGPGAAGVEAHIGLPVAQGEAAFAFALVGEGQVVVGIGIARGENDGLAVGGDRFFEALQLVEDVAEVEEGQDVGGVFFGGAAVELLGAGKFAEVEVDGAEIDEGGQRSFWHRRPAPLRSGAL